MGLLAQKEHTIAVPHLCDLTPCLKIWLGKQGSHIIEKCISGDQRHNTNAAYMQLYAGSCVVERI